MRKLERKALIFVLAGWLSVCGGASAANQLANADFATDVSGWSVDGGASVVFSAVDANGSGSSGSARVTNASPTLQNGAGIYRCGGAVTAGGNYTYGGKVLYPTGQANTGSLQVGIRWLGGANCTGSTIGSQPRLSVNAPNNSWISLASGTVQAPVGAVSVLFLAFPSKVEAGGTLIGQFDDLYVDNSAVSAPVILSAPPPGGTAGVPYSFTYSASGSGILVFSVTSGALPTGLTLSSGGVISGTPTAPGTFTGTVTATNGTAPDATQNFSITIAAAVAAGPAAIPTLGQWALILLATLIAALAVRPVARRSGRPD